MELDFKLKWSCQPTSPRRCTNSPTVALTTAPIPVPRWRESFEKTRRSRHGGVAQRLGNTTGCRWLGHDGYRSRGLGFRKWKHNKEKQPGTRSVDREDNSTLDEKSYIVNNGVAMEWRAGVFDGSYNTTALPGLLFRPTQLVLDLEPNVCTESCQD